MTEIVDALDALGGFLGLGQSGQKQAGKDRNDGDDHEQLDKRESLPSAAISFIPI